MKPWQLTNDDVQQIWAEALVIFERNEKLYLDSDLEDLSQMEQSAAMEQDDREGLVNAYLNLLLPVNWSELDLYERQEYIRDPEAPTQPKGSITRNDVSNLEIWCVLRKRKEDIKPPTPSDSGDHASHPRLAQNRRKGDATHLWQAAFVQACLSINADNLTGQLV